MHETLFGFVFQKRMTQHLFVAGNSLSVQCRSRAVVNVIEIFFSCADAPAELAGMPKAGFVEQKS